MPPKRHPEKLLVTSPFCVELSELYMNNLNNLNNLNNPNNLSDLADFELVSSIALHDEEAFAELFRRHATSVGAASRMILGRTGRCDDVVAEVFLALWLTPESFDPLRGTLLGFLRLKAKGKSIDIVRSEAARARRERSEGSAPREADPPIDAALMAAESAAVVEVAVATLTPEEREPIELAFHRGMTYQTIAVYLGIPEGTIKSRIRSGLRHLREYIELQRDLAEEQQCGPSQLSQSTTVET